MPPERNHRSKFRGGGAALILVAVTASGVDGGPVPAPPGPAAGKVTVVRNGQVYPVTAEITGWEITVHPQVPDRGAAVRFTDRFVGTPPDRIELQICAVDDQRTVLLCDQVYDTGDGWLGPYPPLARTAAVVLLPNQMYPGLHSGDPKDHDGYVPPRFLLPGDRVPS